MRFFLLALASTWGCGDVVKSEADSAPIGSDASAADASGADAGARASCDTANGQVFFVNTNGGNYTMGSPSSPVLNRSSVIQTDGSATGWQVPASTKDVFFDCLRQTMAPFNVVITDAEPAAEPYHEIVITSDASDTELFQFQTASIGQIACPSIDNTISFVFTALRADPIENCRGAASMIGFTQGLSRVVPMCEDAMTFTFECQQRVDFFNGDQTCGQNTPMPCFCGGDAQNSFQRLTQAFGACPD